MPAERCIRIGDNKGAQVRERQFLADGRHRPVRPVLRDLLRPRSGGLGRPARIARGRRRPLHRDLEPRVHAVRPRRQRHADTAAHAVRRHRHGPRAPRGRAAARAPQLRDRSLPGPDPRRGARDGRQGLSVAEPARDRRSHPRLRVPDRRRRDPGERRTRLRAAPDHPPRDPSWLPARPEEAVLPQARRRPRPRDGRRLSRAAPREGARRAGAEAGRGALRRDARERDEDARSGAARATRRSSTAPRRSRCTTRSDFRSTLPPTSAASAA